MHRWHAFVRKAFVATLWSAELGLGLIAAVAGVPSEIVQEASTPVFTQDESGPEKDEVRERQRSIRRLHLVGVG
jgi:hypothetical protein